MHTLLLLRHAKSDWSDRSLADHDRPLAPRGRRAAPAMARYMAAEGILPRTVLCSTALRTRETWADMEDRIGPEATVIYEEELYGASAGDILEIVARVSDAGPALVLGHNPGLAEAASLLAGEGEEGALSRMRRKFPTAALAVLEAAVDGWDELEPGACTLERFVRPKDLPEAKARNL